MEEKLTSNKIRIEILQAQYEYIQKQRTATKELKEKTKLIQNKCLHESTTKDYHNHLISWCDDCDARITE